MNSRKSFATVVGLLAIASPAAQAIITTNVTGVYDETGRGNSVDASFGNAPTGGTGPAPTLLNVSTFKPLVAAAYAAGLGGVMTFDDVTLTENGQTSMVGKYGAGNNSTFTITNTGSSTNGTWSFNMAVADKNNIAATPISGENYLRLGNPLIVFNLSTPVDAFAFTVLGRNAAREVNLTITYNNGTTATYGTYTVGASGSATGASFAYTDTSANDTFFGFQAPVGLAISKVSFNTTAGTNVNPVLDDIAFIIPEPSAFLLSALGALGLITRRRRN